jgi:hypothetical protein
LPTTAAATNLITDGTFDTTAAFQNLPFAQNNPATQNIWLANPAN